MLLVYAFRDPEFLERLLKGQGLNSMGDIPSNHQWTDDASDVGPLRVLKKLAAFGYQDLTPSGSFKPESN